MHIAYLLSGFHSESGGGGAESYVTTMADALVNQGHHVSIIALAQTGESNGDLRLRKVKSSNLHWYLYRGLPFGKSVSAPVREFEWSSSAWRALSELHRRDPVDVVETGENIALQQLVVAEKPPVVVRAHGNALSRMRFDGSRVSWGDSLARKFQVSGIRHASAITAVSRFQAKEIASELSVAEETIRVIPNPISPVLLKAAIDLPETKSQQPVVLYTGRIERNKGTLELLGSVDQVASHCSNVEYVMAGARHNSIDDRTLERALRTAGTRERVRMLGHVAWEKLAGLYRRSTVFVMPSYYETFGISVIEAMAFGLPVVASNVGGLPEVVENGITGLLVPPGDVGALADAIVGLLHDDGLRVRMGKAGQERVQAEFTVDRIVPKTLAVYESVIKTRAGALARRHFAKSCAS